ncbi:BTB/POZ domain-containing protein [Quillaja saponaria]|uniref:BTB/POZ domain-containing protein n=1 Tax=Quillaja saponaria TaxID=32244 RepID=A0AAD7QL48_QUISA|nr:BTB/POZ domain-containing protein [Quillaja saponaria]
MAGMKMGAKFEAFHREGQTWLCTTGLPSDVTIEVGDMSFLLHKFPLISRKITALNVVSLRCAAEYLQMTEDCGEGNLIAKAEAFLDEVFSNWTDSKKALETCEEVEPYAEDLHIISRCIDSLAVKAYSDPNLFNLPEAGDKSLQSPWGTVLWNGIYSEIKPPATGDDWWYEEVSSLSLYLYKRLILAIEAKGMKLETIAASIIYYCSRYLPLMNRQSSFSETNHVNSGTTMAATSEADQRALLEEIRKLEKRVGAQLDQAVLVDLLIPNMGYSVETLYDIDCVQRILDYFMSIYKAAAESSSPCIIEEGQLISGTDTLTPLTMVANLVDGYLAEVAPDVNLKLLKFQALAAVVPDYARPLDDGIYHAIDVYLKAHPWLTDSEREQLCRLMNCQKLSLEASAHAAQNERLPLRVIVQVLFFEQLRLRTSISGWFFVSDNLDNTQNPSGHLGPPQK